MAVYLKFLNEVNYNGLCDIDAIVSETIVLSTDGVEEDSEIKITLSDFLGDEGKTAEKELKLEKITTSMSKKDAILMAKFILNHFVDNDNLTQL